VNKRLLFLVANDRYFCTHRLPLAIEAKKQGYSVMVATPALGDHLKIIEAGLDFTPLPFDRGSLNPLKALKTLWHIIRLFNTYTPHIVHLVALKPVLLGTLAARVTGVPVIINAISGLGHVFASGSWLKYPLKTLLTCLLRTKQVHVIVQNPEDYAEIAPLAHPQQTHLFLGAGVNTQVFQPSDTPPLPPFVVTHVSRLLWSKGVGDLVEAARLLMAKNIPIQVQVVGTPDTENPNAIEQEILTQWQQEGIITWLGQRDDIQHIYQQSHVAVLASYYREGIPKSLLEALACGKPIITCDMPGCRLTVQNGENGFLIPPKNPHQLAKALEILYKNQELREKMARKSRTLALEKFSEEKIIQETMKLYM
jgi:glycosyltransferase involved in cell wall biosynthesis